MPTGPLYGIIDQPYIGERFEGGLGRAAWSARWAKRRCATRAPRPLSQAILFSTFPEVGTPEEGAAFRRVAAGAKLVRYGTDCYAYALIAAGQIDLVIEAGLQAYDVQAPIAVIEAAGGSSPTGRADRRWTAGRSWPPPTRRCMPRRWRC